MLNCFKCKLIPPPRFIKCNCSQEYKTEIWVDACLAKEITELWTKGIRTTGCCCGHGKERGTIGVDNRDIYKMDALGYEEECPGIYYTKTTEHLYFGESKWYNG